MRRAALAVALTALEALWLAAWLRWVAAVASPGVRPIGFGLALGVGLAAVLLTQLLLASGVELVRLRPVTLAGAVVAALVVARLALYPTYAPTDLSWMARFGREVVRGVGVSTSAGLLALTVAYLWWRGTRLAVLRPTPRRVGRRVSVALVALGVLSVAVHVTHPVDLGPALAGGFVAALAALGLSRLEDASVGRGGTSAPLDPTWVALLVGAVVVAGGLALALLSVVSLEAARTLTRALAPLPQVLYRVLVVVILGVVQVLSAVIFRVVRGFYQLLTLMAGGVTERAPPEPTATPEALPPSSPLVWPPWLLTSVRVALALVVLALVARWLARALQRYYDREAGELAAERRSELSLGRAASDVADALRAAASAVGRRLGRLRRWRRDPLRRWYAALLAGMAERGRARPTADTPYEYQPVPERQLPAVRDDIAALTAAYVALRYGERQPSATARARLAAGWHRVRDALDTASTSSDSGS